MSRYYSDKFTGRKKSKTYKETWKHRSKNLNGESYYDFLNSDYWKRIKKKTENRKTYQSCKICGKKENLELHHKHYDLINTKHELSAIIAVCRSCHQAIHDYASKRNSSLRASTRRFYIKHNGSADGY